VDGFNQIGSREREPKPTDGERESGKTKLNERRRRKLGGVEEKAGEKEK